MAKVLHELKWWALALRGAQDAQPYGRVAA